MNYEGEKNTMKTITIKQPWATLIMQGDKRFEFRNWQTAYRGELLIHEGKNIYTKSSFKENYGWQVDNVQVFDEPIEAKGHLSLWEYNIEK